MSKNSADREQLLLPPPRLTLLAMQMGAAFTDPRVMSDAAALWGQYHAEVARAMAYEVALVPSEKAPGRWQGLKDRAVFAARAVVYFKRRHLRRAMIEAARLAPAKRRVAA